MSANISLFSKEFSETPPVENMDIKLSWPSIFIQIDEHEELQTQALSPHEMTQKCAVGFKNFEKNRSSWLPFDHNRVRLINHQNDPQFNDYISASWIKVRNHRYIAAQAPIEETIPCFLTMAIEQRCKVIVMLTNLEETIDEKREIKSAKYWPESGKTVTFNHLSVTCTEERMLAQGNGEMIVERFLRIEDGKQSYPLMQIHYLNWPDGGIPTLDMFYQLMARVDCYDDGYEAILVHCAGGIGRTGVLLAGREIKEQAEEFRFKLKSKEHAVPTVKEIVSSLRSQRVNMVHTQQQYLFCYNMQYNLLENAIKGI